ncbi:hypothetical protein K438DRAFT_1976032 [Mycena galopus ATCC 62051]|nr:hypothetical protein K438DRAFT_1976032 [Mycena galopus ATCC 62051]
MTNLKSSDGNSPQAVETPRHRALRRVRRRIALQKYSEKNAESLKDKARQRMQRGILPLLRSMLRLGPWQIITIEKGRKRRDKYRDQYGRCSLQDFYDPLLKFFGQGTLTGVTIIDQTRRRRGQNFTLTITDTHEEAKELFLQAEKALPAIGKYEILRCDSIAEAVLHWERLCAARHTVCDLAQRAQLDLATGLLALNTHRYNKLDSYSDEGTDSDDDNVLLETAERIVTVVTSDAALPDRTLPNPPMLPVDQAAARQLGVPWTANRNGASKGAAVHRVMTGGRQYMKVERGSPSVSVKPEEPLGTIKVGRRAHTPKKNIESPSPFQSVSLWADGTPPRASSNEPAPTPTKTAHASSKRALPVHSDATSWDSVPQALMEDGGGSAMDGVKCPPASPTITSASSLSASTTSTSSTAFSSPTTTTRTPVSTATPASLAPYVAMMDSVSRVTPVPLSPDVATMDSDGENLIFFNPITRTIYRDMDFAVLDMERQGKLKVFTSAREFKEAMKKEGIKGKGKGKQVA